MFIKATFSHTTIVVNRFGSCHLKVETVLGFFNLKVEIEKGKLQFALDLSKYVNVL